ncbi:hypothetical protein DPMN_044730 [Dreissena polymorpha]|uniref:Uncharacterized protein n=1 Tax=Dreissena polymorpha TaxID=45954 RepID=A0A9D4D3G9_DREPO|nr:hypothetical protein DPMN_044730 [Dreissena polymorpha]
MFQTSHDLGTCAFWLPYERLLLNVIELAPKGGANLSPSNGLYSLKSGDNTAVCGGSRIAQHL